MLQGFLQIFLTLLIVVGLTPLLGRYFVRVSMERTTVLNPIMKPVERCLFWLCGIEPHENMTGRAYAQALLVSNTSFAVLVLLLLTFQGLLPLNPTDRAAMPGIQRCIRRFPFWSLPTCSTTRLS